MDGIRHSSPQNFGLLNTLSTPPQVGTGVGPATAPPPVQPPPPSRSDATPPAATSDSLAGRLSSFRASQDLPAIQHGDELRSTVHQVGLMLSHADSVPFNFDRGAVAHLLSSPSSGSAATLPSPPEPASRIASSQPPPPAVRPSGSGTPVQGLLSFLGG